MSLSHEVTLRKKKLVITERQKVKNNNNKIKLWGCSSKDSPNGGIKRREDKENWKDEECEELRDL